MRAGTEAPMGQSPTPTLLRTIQSRPSTGKSHPVYPSPAWQLPQIETSPPPPPAVVPQKRTAQGTPIVQKIVYKPFNVPKLKDSEPVPALQVSVTPSRPPRKPASKKDRPRAERQTSPVNQGRKAHEQRDDELGLITSLFEDDDDDLEMLELDLEGSDFAAKPRPESSISKPPPPPRVRPNAPPPFKPPLPPQKPPMRKPRKQPSPSPTPPVRDTSPLFLPIPSSSAPVDDPPSLPPIQSSLSISPSKAASPPADNIFPSSPIARNTASHRKQSLDRSRKPASPQRVETNPDVNSGRQDEDIENAGDKVNPPPKRLTLPSAASRTRRKLLCGPSGRNAVANTAPIARPVSTLSILHTFPKDDPLAPKTSSNVPDKPASAATLQPKKPVKKDTVKKAQKPFVAPRAQVRTIDVPTKLEEDDDDEPVLAAEVDNKPRHAPSHPKSSASSRISKIEKAIKPEPTDDNDDELPLLENPNDDQIPDETVKSGSPETEDPAPNEQANEKPSKLQIFSSDEEELEPPEPAVAPKLPKKKIITKKPRPPSPHDSDSDDFEALRLSGIPKRANEPRDGKTLKGRPLSEASRVWREVEEGTVPRGAS
ncbi:hypothetical protein TWF696_001680 [Orbilia brochopaga]|uniref:Uncharacterized protein n=1 Tax=Orbilia brochopaga TaxID=3140254 RepID=A0AAV9U5G4_9PEZI